MKKSILSIVLCFLSVPVDAVVINFDTPTLVGGIERVERYTESGVVFSGAFNHVDTGISGTPFNGTAFMQYESFSSLNFGMSDDSLMNLVSIDLSELSSGPVSVEFIGQLPGSIMVSQTFTTDGIFGTGNDFETFFFDDVFQGVDYFFVSNAFHGNHFAFDNVNIDSVPLPASVWLFVSGLLGFMGLARRKN